MIIAEFLQQLFTYLQAALVQIPLDNTFGLLYVIGNAILLIFVGLFGGGTTNDGGGLFGGGLN